MGEAAGAYLRPFPTQTIAPYAVDADPVAQVLLDRARGLERAISPASPRHGRLSIERVPICCVARRKGASRQPSWRKAGPTTPPEPTRAGSAKRFQRAISVEYFDGGAGPRVDVIERLMSGVRSHRRLTQPVRQARQGPSRADRPQPWKRCCTL